MPTLKVLVVEDEAATRELLAAILGDDGYQVTTVADGREALKSAADSPPDLVLLDCALPGSNGVDVARRLRQDSNLPIIFVTGADSTEDIREGFRVGADDYIVKPFDSEELSWRVRAVLRRSGHSVAQRWEFGDLVVDEGTRSVTRAGEPIALTATEFDMLALLMRNRTRVVPKMQLLGLWGHEADDHTLEVHMSALRRKLEEHGERIIHTVRGVGYVLRDERRAAPR